MRPEFGVVKQGEPDLFDRLARLLDVGRVVEPDVELDRRPVAAGIGQLLDLAEGDGVDLSALVAQLHRAQRNLLDRALQPPGVDIFADAEGVLEHEEDAGDDVAHQRLRTEGDGEAEDAEAGEQRANIDAHA